MVPPRPRSIPLGPPLRIGVLGSGSGGNSVIVESGPHRLLIDAGFSCRELVRRMKRLDFDPSTLSALLLTHEHVVDVVVAVAAREDDDAGLHGSSSTA